MPKQALNQGRGERMMSVLSVFLRNPNRSYSAPDILNKLELPESQIRNVQRDLEALADFEVGSLLKKEGEKTRVTYRCALKGMGTFLFLDSDDKLSDLCFLNRIKGMYPEVAGLIDDVLKTLFKDVEGSKAFKALNQTMNAKVVFMGHGPAKSDASAEQLSTFLKAIRDHRKVLIKYTDNNGITSEKARIPLLIVVSDGELYIGCQSQSAPGNTYYLKLLRVQSVKLLSERYAYSEDFISRFRERISGSASLLGSNEGTPEDIKIIFPGWCRKFLEERPYHTSQKITENEDGTILVRFRLKVDTGLTQWVAGYLNLATVIEPDSLKSNLLKFGQLLLSKYYLQQP